MKAKSPILGLMPCASRSQNLRFLIILILFTPFLIISPSSSFGQLSDSMIGGPIVLEAGEFDGHSYTPPADWIVDKMHTPTQSLIGDPPCSTIDVTYDGFTPEAQAAFQAAVDIWETVLSGSVPVTIHATWEPLGGTTLGYASPRYERNFDGAPTSDYYVAALAKQIAGETVSPGFFDVFMTFNSNYSWYLGTDGNPADDEHDLMTVVLHEIGHGLGFLSSAKYNSGDSYFGVGETVIPANSDNFLTLGSFGTDLLDLSGIALRNAFTSNNVFNSSPLAVAANGGLAPKMYAPTFYDIGSSMHHWDEDTYPAGNSESLMTPFIGSGEANHNPGALAIGLLEDLGWTICYPIPANDLPCDAIAIECGPTVVGSTEYATNSETGNPSCAFGSQKDVFYSFIPIPGYSYSVTVNGPEYDGVLVIYSGTCLGLEELHCMDDGTSDGIAETIEFTHDGSEPAPETFFIRTYDWFSTGGSFELSLTCTPPNDAPCDAINLDCNSSVAGNTGGATSSGIGSFSCSSPSIQDVFYKWTADPNFDYTISVIGENYDGVLALYTGTCGSLTQISCADNGFTTGEEESLTFSTLFSQTIYIRTTDWSDSGGDFVLKLECASANQSPCEAFPIVCGQTVTGSTYGGSQSGLESPTCANGSYIDAFYEFEATPGFTYQVVVNGDDYDGVLVAYSGLCDGPHQELACADDNYYPGEEEEITFVVDAPTNVLIRTYDYVSSGGEFNLTLNCTEIFDCPDLSLNIGDACDDGNPNTNGDSVNSECACVGSLIPSNDLCIYALEIYVNEPSGCPAVQTIGTTIGASDETGAFSCDGGDSEWPDVFYTFDSGQNQQIIWNIEEITQTDLVVSVSPSCQGAPIACETGTSNHIFSVEPYTEYIVRVAPNLSYGEAGTFSICFEGVYDCPELEAYIGDACNDGNPATSNDTVNASCNCEGTYIPDDPCDAITIECGQTLSGSTEGATAGALGNPNCYGIGGSLEDVFYIFSAFPGFEYQVLVNGANYDGTIIAYSGNCTDLTEVICSSDPIGDGVEEEINFSVEVATNIFIRTYDYETSQGSFNITLNCTEAYDCPALSLNIGDACNDGNPGTENDMVNAACNCVGTIIYDCPALSLNIGDACNDGNPGTENDMVDAGCNCVGTIIYDCPALSLNIGDACNDGNPGTENDMVDAGCNCVGTIIYDCPALSLNIGDACNDGNPGTENDMVDAECSCVGTIIYDCPALSLNIGDACNDGNPGTENDMVDAECSCVGTIIYDCPALSLNIGDACNDGNPGTENDLVDAGCNCVGTIIYDCPALQLNIGDICSDGDPTTFADMITADCNCVGISIYDCPDLSADVGDSCDDGDATTINDEVTINCICTGEPAGDASLSGSADWNTNCSSRPIEIALYNAGTSTHITTLGFDINADGTFATSMDYLGTFDIYIKIDGYLRKGFYNYVMSVGGNSLNIGSLTPGDLNGDNGVNVVDFSILSNAFGSSVGDANFNSLSDLNCDGGVNIVDFSMLSASFGMEGVALP